MKKDNSVIIAIFLMILIIIGLIFVLLRQSAGNSMGGTSGTTSSTGTSTIPAGFDQSVSDGAITVAFPSSDFALATTPAQILVHPNIPPCDPTFNYCLYYSTTTYQGTNFESAGLRIEKRTDLTTQAKCLNTEPAGYTNIVPTIASSTDGSYVTSVFSPLGNAAAGHYAVDVLYRLAYQSSCYEFETRIGQSQFANYPAGSIKQFTSADQAAVQTEMNRILDTVTLPSGEQVAFPQATTTTVNM